MSVHQSNNFKKTLSTSKFPFLPWVLHFAIVSFKLRLNVNPMNHAHLRRRELFLVFKRKALNGLKDSGFGIKLLFSDVFIT